MPTCSHTPPNWPGDDVVSLFLALHVMALQYILDLAHIMVYEYIRNHYSGQQARELTKEKRGGSQPYVEDLGHTYVLLIQSRCRSLANSARPSQPGSALLGRI